MWLNVQRFTYRIDLAERHVSKQHDLIIDQSMTTKYSIVLIVTKIKGLLCCNAPWGCRSIQGMDMDSTYLKLFDPRLKLNPGKQRHSRRHQTRRSILREASNRAATNLFWFWFNPSLFLLLLFQVCFHKYVFQLAAMWFSMAFFTLLVKCSQVKISV